MLWPIRATHYTESDAGYRVDGCYMPGGVKYTGWTPPDKRRSGPHAKRRKSLGVYPTEAAAIAACERHARGA